MEGGEKRKLKQRFSSYKAYRNVRIKCVSEGVACYVEDYIK